MSPVDLLVIIAIGWLLVRAVRKMTEQKERPRSPYAGFPDFQVRGLPDLDNLEPDTWVRVVRASNPALVDTWAQEARRRGFVVEWVGEGKPMLDGWRVRVPPSPPRSG